MSKSIKFMVLLIVASYGANSAAQEPAEPRDQQPGYEQPQDRSSDFADETIENFASAYSDVFQIQRQLSEELQDTSDRDEAMEMQREAQDEMLEVVEDNGLSVEKYNDVVAAMQSDIVLRNRILDLIGR